MNLSIFYFGSFYTPDCGDIEIARLSLPKKVGKYRNSQAISCEFWRIVKQLALAGF